MGHKGDWAALQPLLLLLQRHLESENRITGAGCSSPATSEACASVADRRQNKGGKTRKPNLRTLSAFVLINLVTEEAAVTEWEIVCSASTHLFSVGLKKKKKEKQIKNASRCKKKIQPFTICDGVFLYT